MMDLNMCSNKLFLAVALLSATNTWALEAGEPVDFEAGNGYFYPSVGVQLSHDDNILLSNTNEKSSMITVITPKFRWEADGEASQVGLTFETEAAEYHSSNDDNYVDWRALAEVAYFPTERVSYYGAAKFNHDHEARGSTASSGSAKPDEYDLWELNGRLKYGLDEEGAPRFELEYTHSDREYTNNRASTASDDRKTDELTATLFYKVAPLTSLLLEGSVTQLDYDIGTSDSDQTRLLVGVTWEATAATTGFAKVGRSEKEFDNTTGSNTNTDNASWEVGVTWAPLTYSTVNFSTNRDYSESSGTGSHNDSTSTSVSWTHAWQSHFDTTLSFSRVNDDYVNSTREDDVDTIQLNADYRMNHWLVFGAGYKHVERDSNTAGLDYEDNVVTLSAGINM